jgi:hypothetical protein
MRMYCEILSLLVQDQASKTQLLVSRQFRETLLQGLSLCEFPFRPECIKRNSFFKKVVHTSTNLGSSVCMLIITDIVGEIELSFTSFLRRKRQRR